MDCVVVLLPYLTSALVFVVVVVQSNLRSSVLIEAAVHTPYDIGGHCCIW